MGRYNESDIVVRRLTPNRKQRVKALETAIYKQIPKRDDDIYVITQQGDRLDNLAFRFYGDVNLWWYIAQANDLFTMNIEPNTSLRIPSDLTYTELEKR